jgi:hypothetical protein
LILHLFSTIVLNYEKLDSYNTDLPSTYMVFISKYYKLNRNYIIFNNKIPNILEC